MVDVAEVEADGLGAAQSGRVDELDERAVSQRRVDRLPRRGSPSTSLDLVELRRVGQPAGACAALERSPREPERDRARSARATCTAESRRAIVAGASFPLAGATELGRVVGEHADVDLLERPLAVPLDERAQIGGVGTTRRGGDPGGAEVAVDRSLRGSPDRFAPRYDRLPWTHRFRHSPSSPSTARTCSRAGGRGRRDARPGGARARGRRRGVPRARATSTSSTSTRVVKRARILNADPETLEYVPPGTSSVSTRSPIAATRGSRSPASSRPTRSTGLDPALLGRDQLPWLKEVSRVDRRALDQLDDRPLPAPRLGAARVPRARRGGGLRAALGASSGTSCVSTSPIRRPRGTQRIEALKRSAQALNERRFDALELRGPGTELTVGLLPGGSWEAGDFRRGRASATSRTCPPRRCSPPRIRRARTAT
jgi:hypothetical protein